MSRDPSGQRRASGKKRRESHSGSPFAVYWRCYQNKIVCALLILLVVVCPLNYAGAQQAAKQTDQDEVIRVKTDLVQVNAVVTDKKGQLVENLKQEDFEILENGKAQPLSFFSASRIAGESNVPVAKTQKPDTVGEQSPPDRNVKPARTIVLFVDTVHLSTISLMKAKQQLKQFVDEKMTDQDLAAVVTTSSSLGVLQQFMRDRRMLKYAIDKITSFPRSSSFFTPFLAAKVLETGFVPGSSEAVSVATSLMAKEEGNFAPPPQAVLARAKQILDEESVMRRATLVTIKGVSDRMANMPGQRMIAFVSDGFTLLGENGSAEHEDFFEATGRAARSGVIIYSFNPQGLQTPVEFTAAAPLGGFAFGNFMHDSQLDQQDTLRDIARVTGGEAYLNSNDILGQFKKMLDANRVYYAIAYYPQAETDKKFRNIKVRVKNHPEYHVRTQTGYQPTVEKKSEIATTPQQELFQAMVAPLPLTTIGVTSSADYLERNGDDAKVTLQVHFAGDLLEYPAQEQKHSMSCEVAVAVLDHEGKIGSSSLSETISAAFTDEQLEKAKRNGYRYSKRINLAPGLYQLRIGVRDANGSLMGTSTSWANVPDLSKKKLTLSSIFLGKELEEKAPVVTSVSNPTKPSLVVGQASFKSAEPIFYRFVLYNSASAGPSADLQMKVEILESGANAYNGSWQPLTPRIVRSDGMGLEIGGQLRMEVGPGIYTLRITVKDPKSNKEAQQTIAFEIA